MILKVVDDGRQPGLADRRRRRPRATQVDQQAGGLHHHRHPGRQHRSPRSTRTGASGRSTTDGRADRPPTRPVRPATTSTSHAYGFLAPPKDKTAPALAVGVWMGNSNNDPNDGSLSLDSSAPLWSAILTRRSARACRSPSSAARRAQDGRGRRVHRAQARAVHRRRPSRSCSCRARSRRSEETIRSGVEIDEASGLLWQDGCVGPKVTKGFFNLSEVEADFPNWQKANAQLGGAGGRGPGRAGAARRAPGRRTSTTTGFRPFGRSWGAPFAPTENCPIAAAGADPIAASAVRDRLPPLPESDRLPADPSRPAPAPAQADARSRRPARRVAAQKLDDRRPVAALAPFARADRLDQRVARRLGPDRVAQGARAEAVDDRSPAQARQRRVVEVALERLQRLLDPRAAQVERRGDACRARLDPQRRPRSTSASPRRRSAPLGRRAVRRPTGSRAPARGRRARP